MTRPLLFVYLLLAILISCSGPADYQRSYTWEPVEINQDVEASGDVEEIITPYRARLDSIMDEVIGYASHDLTTKGQYESTLGTFVTKLLLEQAIAEYQKPVDVAIMNHQGGLRAPINEGPIRLGEAFEVMPFENDMILLEVPGDTILQVINFISRSGRSMIWPVSFTVTDSGVENILVNGEEIDSSRTYILSISDYLANGGSGFRMLKGLKRLEVTPVKLRDMIINEIKQRTAKGDSIRSEVANLVIDLRTDK